MKEMKAGRYAGLPHSGFKRRIKRGNSRVAEESESQKVVFR